VNRIVFSLLLIAVIAVWSSPSFAQQVVGASTSLSSGVGEPQGADMTGAVTLTVPDGFGVYTNNSSGGNVVNSTLVAIHNNSAGAGLIVFSGNSNVFGAIGQVGTVFNNVSAGTAGNTVNLYGNVYSTTFTVSGTGTANFDSGSTNVTATNFAGDGTIGLSANTIINGALTTNTADTGTLSLGGGSVLNGAVGGANGLKTINVVGGSNTAGVSATITGAVDAFTFGLGTNTLNITGALTIANNSGVGGVINTTLASATVFGNIRPVGASNLGSALTVNVLVPSTAFFPVGTQFNIIQTQTGTSQNGTNGSVVTVTVQNPTNPLYTFAATPLSGTVAGLVTIQATAIPLQVAVTPSNPVAAPVATTLLNIPNPSADLTIVLAALNALSDPAAVLNATAQLAPSTPNLAAPLVIFQGARQFQDLWLARMDDTMCGQVGQLDDKQTSSCQRKDEQSGWWMKGFGNFSNQDTRSGFSGYDSQVLGTMIAYDVPIDTTLSSQTRAGLGVGYARSAIDGKGVDTSIDANTYKATAYIGHEQDLWFVNGDVSFGWNDYSSTRYIVFPGIDRRAQASYSGQEYTGFATTGYHFPLQGFTLTPLASLQYTHMNLNGYRETGAGDINLNVKSQSYDFLESGLGAQVAHSYLYDKGTYVPELHAKWLHEINNPALSNTSTFATPGSASFTTPGLATSDNIYNVGAGLTFLSCSCSAETWALEAVYDYDWRADGYSSNQGMIKLTSHF